MPRQRYVFIARKAKGQSGKYNVRIMDIAKQPARVKGHVKTASIEEVQTILNNTFKKLGKDNVKVSSASGAMTSNLIAGAYVEGWREKG